MKNEIEQQFRLDGKTILVTGASSGIGRQTAINIAAMGGKVVATGRSENGLAETLSQLKGLGHKTITADLTKDADLQNIAAQVEKLDGIVHSAGVIGPYPSRFINREKNEEMFAINYEAPVFLMTALFKSKKINRGCSIVFISSFAAQYPYATGALYASTKAALEAYSKVLAIENAPSGMRCNCICPALVKGKMDEQTFDVNKDPESAEKRARYEKQYLLGLGLPMDVANMAIFLLSPAARWITGQNFNLDGGYLLGVLSNSLANT